ncbi:hypothetical protein [Streptomyces sp. G-G2]|uniref:hypothetical protein n=1 Tax=Streptomyces sp. G-G2 TaxID=3046201 RepID=UPI0024BA09B0|nr:hypothetical protein [Streptomyces sp. G-G2]MDJ0385449.1 hypothetical protein [Streptomyces sp. G-G2]
MFETEQNPHRARRRRRSFRLAAALLVLLGLAGYYIVQNESTGGDGAPHCTVTAAERGGGSTGGSYAMSLEQARYASTIAAVGSARKMPERAVTIAMATALQESALRNLDHGDRDSLGLFQQRPSQGWGTPAQIMDPVYSAGIFYDRLLDEAPDYADLPLTVAAQKVQRSGFPDAYAKHEPDAVLLAAAFTGRAPGTLSCSGPLPQATGDAVRVKAELVKVFGTALAPKAGPPASPVRTAPAAADDSEVTMAVSGKDHRGPADQRRGWELANWAVAHASDLGVQRVSYDNKAWIAGKNKGRWIDKPPGASGDGDARNAGADDVRIFVAPLNR